MKTIKRKRKKVLVLNADWQPWCLTSWKRAIVLSIINEENPKQGVSVIDFYKNDSIRCSGGRKIPVPAVVLMVEYQKNRKKVAFSRKNVYLRDKLSCQYCGFFDGDTTNLTYDHVIPRALWKKMKLPGTPTNWKNIVTSCISCNRKKGDKTLKEAGLKLLNKPHEPNPVHYIPGLSIWGKIPQEWMPYLTHTPYLKLIKSRENFKKVTKP